MDPMKLVLSKSETIRKNVFLTRRINRQVFPIEIFVFKLFSKLDYFNLTFPKNIYELTKSFLFSLNLIFKI